MRVLILSHKESDGQLVRGVPDKQRSPLWPLFWWRQLISDGGVKLVVKDFSDGFLSEGFDVVALNSRSIGALPEQDKFLILSRLKNRNGRIVYLDQSDGTGHTDFSVIDYVDIYAKRHLLRNPLDYGREKFCRGIHFSYYSELLGLANTGKRVSKTLSRENFRKVRLSWGFLYSAHPIPHKARRLANQVWPRSPRIRPARYSPVPEPENRLSSTGAFFFGKDDGPVGSARELGRAIISNAGGHVLTSQVSKREFHRLLSQAAIAVSPFGYGEMCHRDFEIAMTGRLLAKPSVDHLVTFPHIMREKENYLPLEWDPRSWVDAIEAADIGEDWAEKLHESFRQEFGPFGRERFASHITTCLFGEGLCSHCQPLLASYSKPSPKEQA